MIDSHAHVMFSQFDEDREEVMGRAREAGVEGWIEVGTDVEQSKKAIALARRHDRVFAAVGVHPSEVETLNEEDWGTLKKLAKGKEVIAIGEVGIDLYRGGSLQKQLEALRRFIGLAGERNLPIVFHVRGSEEVDAHDQVLKLLSAPALGVMHSFSGTWRQAEKYMELGMYLAFNGVVTFKNAGEIAEIARRVPLNRILIETDCPYLAPEPHRGKRNEPAYVKLVAEKIAELRGMTVSEVVEATSDNTERLFGLK
ncbi:MAG: TatD family hydrolase [bacterium]